MELRPWAITVVRGIRGFGLSLIYRRDLEDKGGSGIFAVRVVPGSQAALCGVRENDKILKINGKKPNRLKDAIRIVKQTGNQIDLVVLREENVSVNTADPDEMSLSASEKSDPKSVSGFVF